MNKIHTEFDRTLHKTHKSRYTKFTPTKNRGFTLIELLVVISIIALLSTVVLGSMKDARTKARNTAKNSVAQQYVRAIELYRSNNQSYPVVSIPTCVGYLTTETCYGTIAGSNTLEDNLDDYLPGDYAHRQSLMISGSDFKGILYSCTDAGCTNYSLQWILEERVTKCMNESTSYLFPSLSTGPHLRCVYSL